MLFLTIDNTDENRIHSLAITTIPYSNWLL